VGRQTLERLEALGVRRLGDLDGVLPERLLDACGTMMTRRLLGIRDGSDDATVRPVSGRTVLSSEGAVAGYARRDWTVDELVKTCIRRVCKRATRAGLAATGLTIVLRGETAALAMVQATGKAVALATMKAVVATPTPADDPSLWMRLARAELAALPEQPSRTPAR
jgi:DNA polymerase-4